VLALFNASDSDPSTFGYPQPSFVPLMEAADARVGRVLWLCLRSFDDPGAVLGFYLHRLAGLLTPFEAADNASFYYAAIASPLLGWLPDYAWLLPLAAVGAVLAVASTPLRSLGPLLPVSLALLATNLLAPPLSRYRLPLIVLALPFAGLAAVRAWSWVASRRFATLLAAVLAMVGVWMGARLLERRFVLPGPTPWARVYRLADFYVAAREYERQGRYGDASAEYLALAARVPAGSRVWAQALLFAAGGQAQAGDREAARASVDAVTAHAPADPAILVAVGDSYWRVLGDPAAAAGVYRRAAELHPDGAVLAMLQARQRELDALRPPVTSPGVLR
jgi:tetratricopeptide (TPR) repeat protein